MSKLLIPHEIAERMRSHLFGSRGEHLGFMLARTLSTCPAILLVHDLFIVPDTRFKATRGGWELERDTMIGMINVAVRSGSALVEGHNHGGAKPRFSPIDREGLQEFSSYVLEFVPGRPYAATVWGDSTVYGEVYDGAGSAAIDSILVVGDRMSQLVSRENEETPVSAAFDRQLPWLTSGGQRALGCLRVGVVGAGGLGSIAIQNLAYLGVRDFVVVEDDVADEMSMNRLVTAAAADLESPKAILARRLIRAVAPEAKVAVVSSRLQRRRALEALKTVDVLFGCVDNDGARLVLNEIALAYWIPYFDVAVGIGVDDGVVKEAGGRVCAVLPWSGPCLCCMGEIDAGEARYFLSDPEKQREDVERGYVRGLNVRAPSVVSLNAAVASGAVNEFVMFISGTRPVSVMTEFDLLGTGRSAKAQWTTPVHLKRKPGCIACGARGLGESANAERYDTSAIA